MDQLLVVIRLIHFAGAIGAFGAAAFAVYGLEGASASAAFRRRLARWILICAGLELGGALALVPCIAAEMAGSAAAALDPATLATVLGATSFGRVWCWHLGLVAGLSVAAATGARIALVLTLAAAALGSLGLVGHSATHAGWLGLGLELNQVLHLIAAGAWLGGLPPLVWLLREARRPDGDRAHDLLRHALPSFSRMGYVAVGALALTGAVSTILLGGSPGALVTTPYGRLLLVKIALFLGMVALAAVNRVALVPRIKRDARTAIVALTRTVVAEQAVGLLVLAVVSVLGTWPPPVGMPH